MPVFAVSVSQFRYKLTNNQKNPEVVTSTMKLQILMNRNDIINILKGKERNFI